MCQFLVKLVFYKISSNLLFKKKNSIFVEKLKLSLKNAQTNAKAVLALKLNLKYCLKECKSKN
jgi:hypothetical protein